MKSLQEFKGEEAFKVMGRVISCLKSIFKNEEASKIIVEGRKSKSQAWMMDFLEYSLTENAGEWMNLYCTLNPSADREDVSTQDVINFAFEFFNDSQLMSLFFSQSQQQTSMISIGSATQNTEV